MIWSVSIPLGPTATFASRVNDAIKDADERNLLQAGSNHDEALASAKKAGDIAKEVVRAGLVGNQQVSGSISGHSEADNQPRQGAPVSVYISLSGTANPVTE